MSDHTEEHEAYAAARSRYGPYVYVDSDPQYEEALDLFVDGDGSSTPLVVLGERQSGRTALLCNWLDRRRKNRAGESADFVFSHFVGCSPRSLYLRNVLGRLMAALKRHFDLRDMDVPKSEERLRWGFNRFLSAADRKVKGDQPRIVVVIDGANKIRSEDAERGKLHWLPTTLPKSVRFVLSTTEFDVECHNGSKHGESRMHRTFVELSRRNCAILRVSCLSLDTRRDIINAFFAKHSSNAALEDQKERILGVNLASQPTYLRLLLSAMQLEQEVGIFSKAQLEIYLNSETTERLLAHILNRQTLWIQPEIDETTIDSSALIFILCAIQASRNGLSINEMWGLVNFHFHKNLSQSQKERVIRVLNDLCIVVGGLYLFAHGVVKHALLAFLIEGPSRELHGQMATFFEGELETISRRSSNCSKTPLGKPLPLETGEADVTEYDRQLSCIVWHLEVAGMWMRLKGLLVDIRYFHLWCQNDEFINLWASLISSRQQGLDDDASLVTGPFCHRTMKFHRALRPVFDPVDEYTKSLDTFRKKHKNTNDAFLRKTVVQVATFLLELSIRGHEKQANVPAFHHPHLPMREMAVLGITYIDYKENAFVAPKGKDAHDSEEKEDNLPVATDITSPTRSTYFFHRFVWIHFPIMALDDRSELINKAQKKGFAAEARNGSPDLPESGPAQQDSQTEIRATLSHSPITEVKRPSTAISSARTKIDGANNDFALLEELKREYNDLAHTRLRQSCVMRKICSDMPSRENEKTPDNLSTQHSIHARQSEVDAEREMENDLSKNYKSILNSLRRNPANVAPLMTALEKSLQDSCDLIQSSEEVITAATKETTSVRGQLNLITKAQKDAKEMHFIMITRRKQQINQIRRMIEEESNAFDALRDVLSACASLSNAKLPCPHSLQHQSMFNDFDVIGNTASFPYQSNGGRNDDPTLIAREIKDRTGIDSISTFTTRINDAFGGISDHIDEMKTSSEYHICTLETELQSLREECRAVSEAIDAKAAAEDACEETVLLSLRIKSIERVKTACDDKNETMKVLLLSLQHSMKRIALSLNLSDILSNGRAGLLKIFRQVDDHISILLEGSDAQTGGRGVNGANEPMHDLVNPVDRVHAASTDGSSHQTDVRDRNKRNTTPTGGQNRKTMPGSYKDKISTPRPTMRKSYGLIRRGRQRSAPISIGVKSP